MTPLSLSPVFRIYLFFYNFGVHVRDEADGKLSNDLPGDNSFGSCFREGALNTMKRQRWEPPAVHKDFLLQGRRVSYIFLVKIIKGFTRKLSL